MGRYFRTIDDAMDAQYYEAVAQGYREGREATREDARKVVAWAYRVMGSEPARAFELAFLATAPPASEWK